MKSVLFLLLPLTAAAAALIAGPGCGPRTQAAAAAEAIRFERVTEQAGLVFQHQDGSSGRRFFPEVMGPGCAIFDYDGDGWPDLYLVNGGVLPGYEGETPANKLYRNNGDGTFSDVTEAAGVPGTGYGIGCAAADFDNNGHTDLYVTQFGANVLYRNNGDGTFTDVTAAAGVAAVGFSSGAAFADYDGDGLLDLYVCQYVEFDPLTSPGCSARIDGETTSVYCLPTVYEPLPNILYRNEGGGRFRDVTAEAGMSVPPARSLGCVWTDINDNGLPDLYVANDMSENFLFRNLGAGRFEEIGMAAGVALSSSGHAQAGMGVASADLTGDGAFDLLVTNFTGEYTAMYRNEGGGQFREVSALAGLLEATHRWTGFGIGAEDFDRDGWPDLFIVNGHVTESVERMYSGVTLAQPTVVLRNDGRGNFLPVERPGGGLGTPRVQRGAAFGDFDNDGRVDALIANWRGEPDLLRNVSPGDNRYLTVRLVGTRSNRDAIGARVTVVAGGRTQVREVRSGGSYCSQNDLRLTFGLGAAELAETVTVRWPGGGTEVRRDVPANRRVDWIEGEGDEVEADLRSM
jgi:enediyne biosynthesis protein E4